MDYIFWMGNGTWKPDSWLYLVHYDSWNSIWKAVFQDGKTLFYAIWCECVSTVKGHKGRFVFGYVEKTPVVIMQGRVHYYEGCSMMKMHFFCG